MLHVEIIAELGGRETLSPDLRVQYARHLKIHFAAFERTIGFDAMREIIRVK